LIAGYVVLGGGSVGFLLSEHVYHVFVAQAVNGVGMGLVQPSWKALYAREQDAGREVRQWGWADGTSQVITGVGSVVGGTVVSFFSFDVMFVLMAVVQWCAAGMVVWYAQS
jgi:MFS family permease